jgi:hypothetical protein
MTQVNEDRRFAALRSAAGGEFRALKTLLFLAKNRLPWANRIAISNYEIGNGRQKTTRWRKII